MNPVFKRPFQISDKDILYRICQQTALAGEDASHVFKDVKLLGDIYVGPYLVYQPELVWVMEDEEGICGYLLAAENTPAYQNWFEQKWLPKIREGRVCPNFEGNDLSPDESLLASLFDFSIYRPGWMLQFPAHFHIELLPRIQGKGVGTRCINDLCSLLIKRGCQGVHLGMHPENHQALKFYQKLGFQVLEHADLCWEEVLYLGKNLKPGRF